MTEKGMENNKVTVIGTIVSGFTFSHAVFGEGFYLVDLLVNRLSEQADIIPLMISERLINVTKDYQGCTMEASVSSRVLQSPRGDEEPSGIVRVCQRGPLYGGVHGLHENEPDLSGRIYL